MTINRYSRNMFAKTKVYATAHRITSDLRYARQLAMSKGTAGTSSAQYFGFKFATSTANREYIIFDSVTGHATSTAIKDVNNIDSDMTITSATASYLFATSGEPLPTAGGTIVVQDSKLRYQWNVTVSRVTGKVYLTEIQ